MTSVLAVVLASAMPWDAVQAQGDKDLSADQASRLTGLSRRLMSPFCPGKTLESCPSSQASEWRQDIRRWIAQGMTDQEIIARLQGRMPDFNLHGRPAAGWDWAMPLGAMLLATGLLVFVATRYRRRGTVAAAETSSSKADEERRNGRATQRRVAGRRE